MPGIIGPQAQPYGQLVGGNLKFAGVDQGIDFTGQGPVYALAPGTITAIRRGNAGFNDGLPGGGNELVYSIPSLGKYVYIAEDFIIRNGLKVGDTIKKGQLLGNVNSSYPGIEAGFSTAGGSPLEPLLPRGSSYPASGQGAQFQSFVEGQGGSPLSGIGGVVSDVGSTINSAAQHIPGVQQGEDLLNVATSIPKFLGRLTDPNLWIRILEIVGGSIVALAGLVLLVKNVGLGISIPAPGPAGAVAEAAA